MSQRVAPHFVIHMRRIITYVGALLVLLEVLYLGLIWQQNRDYQGGTIVGDQGGDAIKLQRELSEVMRGFLYDIRKLHPSKGAGNVPALNKYKDDISKDMFKFQDEKTPITVDLLENYLVVTDAWRSALREQHAQVVSKIPAAPLEALDGQGIVLTGGGKLFGQALVAIWYILDYHPGIPIELWMARDEYEPEYCEAIFPQHNVSCIVMEDFYGEEVAGFDYMGYPLKSLALAGSRFKDVYFMDVDSFPLGSIKDLFASKPYKETGFISWPDYWIRITSPDYYDIAGVIDINTVSPHTELHTVPKAVPYATSSETGQIVWDKERHWDAILLSAYYNLNGKEHYYPLFSQSDKIPGFGDKETFISAASVLGHSVYQVSSWVQTLGYFQKPGDGDSYHGSGMVQRDPIMDYELSKGRDVKVGAWSLHCNNMKLDPFFLFSQGEDTQWNKPNQGKNRRRSLGNVQSVIESIGYDVELRLYEVVQNVICEWIVNSKPLHASDEDMAATCKAAMAHVEWLKQDTI